MFIFRWRKMIRMNNSFVDPSSFIYNTSCWSSSWNFKYIFWIIQVPHNSAWKYFRTLIKNKGEVKNGKNNNIEKSLDNNTNIIPINKTEFGCFFYASNIIPTALILLSSQTRYLSDTLSRFDATLCLSDGNVSSVSRYS